MLESSNKVFLNVVFGFIFLDWIGKKALDQLQVRMGNPFVPFWVITQLPHFCLHIVEQDLEIK